MDEQLMTAGRKRSFRLGDRSELLVQHLLAGVAFTTPVPRQEDIGIDFMCSLITGYDKDSDLLKAGPIFFVQAKSSEEKEWVFEKPHELEWIKHQENPILLCVADREAGAMDVYSTWNLLCGVLAGWRLQKSATCIRLCPGRSCSDWRGVEDRPDGSQDILLGKPIIRIAHAQVFDKTGAKEITDVMGQWIALDRENIVNRHAGLNWVVGPLAYETGKALGAQQLGVTFYWNPQNLGQCAVNLGRSAMALWRVLRHPGMPREIVTQAPWSAGISPLRELLLWARGVDPSLRAFLGDLD